MKITLNLIHGCHCWQRWPLFVDCPYCEQRNCTLSDISQPWTVVHGEVNRALRTVLGLVSFWLTWCSTRFKTEEAVTTTTKPTNNKNNHQQTNKSITWVTEAALKEQAHCDLCSFSELCYLDHCHFKSCVEWKSHLESFFWSLFARCITFRSKGVK